MNNLRSLIARLMNGEKRNLWQTFGYPTEVLPETYWRMYRRNGIANRVVKTYPDACWRGSPTVQDEQGSSPKPDQDDYSEFTGAWEDFNDRFGALRVLHRADRLARIGHYAIIVLGFRGSDRLDQPMEGVAPLAYLSTYSERSAKVVEWEMDVGSPRYGLPTMYQVNVATDNLSGQAIRASHFRVHWTRVIHVAENTEENEVFGEPALRPIWNYLLDLEKVGGSGAEAFWLNARGGLSVETVKDATLSKDTLADMKAQIDDYTNDLRRVLAMQGASVKPIALTPVDPTPSINANVQLISGSTGIPQRLLSGSERGELASSEDANSFESRVDERRADHCGPNILIPFINRMIETGNLPEPVGNWMAKWPEASAMSPDKQADIAVKRATAASTWSNGGGDRLIAREEMREMMGLPPESEYDMVEDLDDLDDGDNLTDEDETGSDDGDSEGTGEGAAVPSAEA